MKLLIQFPTYHRSSKFIPVLQKYVDFCSQENELFFNINCDSDDSTMTDFLVIESINEILDTKDNIKGVMNFDQNTEKISAINAHMSDKEFDIVINASDDMMPRVPDWDLEISNAMEQYFPDLDGCVHFNDGNTKGDLITFSILGRKLYEHFGYIYHPDYKSLYCDNEFTEEVRRMGKEKYIDKIIISHEHYSLAGTINYEQMDYAAQKTGRYAYRDEKVFNIRKDKGFPKERVTKD